MSVAFIGCIGRRLQPEILPHAGPAIDVAHVEASARVHEDGGFDRALVAFGSTSPESQHVAAHASTVARSLHVMIAHRPGFMASTLAARR
jgi:alkanesulfonate monooxygenase